MITLIGARCKSGNGLSQGVLIRPSPIGKFEKHLKLTESKIASWRFNAVDTPLHISNRAVKHRCGDGTDQTGE